MERKKYYNATTGVEIFASFKPAGYVEEGELDEKAVALHKIRRQRDKLLKATDFMVSPDMPMSDEDTAAIFAYRQALRDLPNQAEAPWTPETIPWPEKPQAKMQRFVRTVLPWAQKKEEEPIVEKEKEKAKSAYKPKAGK